MSQNVHFDSLKNYLIQEITVHNWVKKMNSKPIEYVDKINTQSIKSVKQRLTKK